MFSSHGLALLSSLPDAPDRDRQEISLQLALGSSLLTARGFTSPDAAGAYARARELCEKPDQGAQLFAALWGLWISLGLARPMSSRRDAGS